MNLVQEFLETSARRFSDKTALICGKERLTYAALDAAANRLARALVDWGVSRGDRVGIYLHNSVETVVSIFAILKANAVFVGINRTTKPEKLFHLLNNCRASALVSDDRISRELELDTLRTHVPSLGSLVVCGKDGEVVHPEGLNLAHYAVIQEQFADTPPEVHPGIDLDLACLVYTSGTTGESKGVMCDHSNVTFATRSIAQYLKNSPDDIVLNALPLSFSYGLYQVFAMFSVGGTLVLERSFAFPAQILKMLESEKITGMPGVPTLYAMMLQLDLSAFDLSRLRYLTNAAAGLPLPHIQELRRRLPNIEIYSMHGLTEVVRTVYLPPELLEEKPGSVGRAMPGTEAWIEDEAGNILGPDCVGELVIRGRNVMRGYWEAPEATAARFRPGLYPNERLCYTGDLFRMDQDGCMYFVSRKDDIIKSRGEKVAPKEVENVLHAMKGVVESVVLGIPDPILGQAIKAVIVASDPQLTATEVLAYCRAHLEDYMIPKVVEFRKSIPKSPSGKIRREELA